MSYRDIAHDYDIDLVQYLANVYDDPLEEDLEGDLVDVEDYDAE